MIGTRRIIAGRKRVEGVAGATSIDDAVTRAQRILVQQPEVEAVEIMRRPERARSWNLIERIERPEA